MTSTTQNSGLAPAFAASGFTNRFVHELPADPKEAPGGRQVRGALYSRVQPASVAAPRLIAAVPEVAELFDTTVEGLADARVVDALAGNRILDGMVPHASCYGGHQFGNWAGQLGDGRAIGLGEYRNAAGEHWELQLKGAGPTPYSRSADGRAVLRSSVREFLCSEAMFHLGVPTTRALSLVATGDEVVRDMFYDGHPRPEPGAIVARVAPSFLRFGHFELPTSRGDDELTRTLFEFCTRHYDPAHARGEDLSTRVAGWFAAVAERTAEMVLHWQRVGFVHGVMNTDNMSILGLTIDYGPYGWLDDYDPRWTPNTTDAQGRRYRFENQPRIAGWNLAQLGNALVPLAGKTQPLEEVLQRFLGWIEAGEVGVWLVKLGLRDWSSVRDPIDARERQLVQGLQACLRLRETDYSLAFRHLAMVSHAQLRAGADGGGLETLSPAFYAEDPPNAEQSERWGEWMQRYAARIADRSSDDATRRHAMDAVNPLHVLRNYLAQEAIDAATGGDDSGIHALLEVIRRPYEVVPGHERFARRRPDWARSRPGCSMLSCSS